MFLYCSFCERAHLLCLHAGTERCTRGVTRALERRIWEHRNGYIKGFTSQHGVHRLVWFEVHDDLHDAIAREKRIKHWRRAWKMELIEDTNPIWRDLDPELFAL